MLKSSACRYEDFLSEWYGKWADLTGYPRGVLDHAHLSYRKTWEWFAIMQALEEREMLRAGRRGIGFAVGSEMLPSIFASRNVEIVATDLPAELSDGFWDFENQHASGLDQLFHPAHVDEARFRRLVRFQPVDMNDLSALPDGTFDFAWSSCAMEHLGGLAEGFDFARNVMRLLKPGGVAVHTTEYNCSSNDETISEGRAVIYRRKDLRRSAASLRRMRCGLEPLDFDIGTHNYDLDYESPPYLTAGSRHLKLQIDDHIATSFLLIVRKAG